MKDQDRHSRPTKNRQVGPCNQVVDCATLTSVTLCPTFWAGLGGGLSVLLSAIGAGMGIGISGPAIAGAGVERPEVMFKTCIATILAEAVAIYELVVGLLSLFYILHT